MAEQKEAESMSPHNQGSYQALARDLGHLRGREEPPCEPVGREGLGRKEAEVDGTRASEEWWREMRGSRNWSGPRTARGSVGAGKGPSQGGRIRRQLGQHFPCLLGPQGAHWGPSWNRCSPRPAPVVLSLNPIPATPGPFLAALVLNLGPQPT